ncbi:MAG: diguanylate cyclase domain-containing protein [Candidatus Humimicrobiaceae bacterium]
MNKDIVKDSSESTKVQILSSKISALEQLLDVYERSVLENTDKLHKEISERRQAELKVKVSEAKFHNLVENAPIGILISLIDGQILIINEAALKIYGFKTEGDFRKSMSLAYSYYANPEDRKSLLAILYEKGMAKDFEVIMKRSDGTTFWASLNVIIQIAESGEKQLISIVEDITERKNAEEKTKYMSFHDYLTGLYNRAFFEEELKRLNVQRNLPLSVVMGDVNGLKMVNDAYGHEKGDELLTKVASILRQSFRKSDIISRWGGDEFMILLPLTNYSIAKEIAGRIEKTCLKFFIEDMPISISLGISTKVAEDESIEDILKTAEDKMYTNKMSDEKRTHRSMIVSLEKTLNKKDLETEDHVRRMEKLSLLLGKDLKLSQIELNELIMLSALHDIGKIAVTDSLILKPGKLSPQEWEMVKKHPEVGYRIAKSSIELAGIADAILAHHENWDGSGYPEGLKGEEIPLVSRIISIVDSYDAMTNDRPYRRSFTKDKALAEIKKGSGIKYDPKLVKVFLRIVN